MVHKFFPNIKNLNNGITLVELVVVIFIIVIFSSIVIADFPKIKKEYALSRATYKLAQDLRRVQDMGLSGVKLTDSNGVLVQTKGYGIYMDIRGAQLTQQYMLYADTCPSVNSKDYYVQADPLFCLNYGGQQAGQDYIVDTINVDDDNSGVFIKSINGSAATAISINFTPPNPNISITDNTGNNNYANVIIVLALRSDTSITRTVTINKSGLITVN